MGMSTFAVTYTVKDEAKLLALAIPYYIQSGCSRIYLYWDGTTDNSKELVKQYGDIIVCRDTVEAHELKEIPEWVHEISPRWRESMDVRKRINTLHAARLAFDEGIDWITSVDPDELIIPSKDAIDPKGAISTFLSNVSEHKNLLFLSNLEAVPTSDESNNPFVECNLFLNRFPVTEQILRYTKAGIRIFTKNPILHAWYEYIFYKIRFPGAPLRTLRHPETNKVIPTGVFLGYLGYKSIIRTRTALESLFNIHKWEKDKCDLDIAYKGYVLHYDLFDAQYTAAKFRQRPPAMQVKAFHARYMIAMIARNSSDEVINKFFNDCIALTRAEDLNKLIARRIVVKIDGIANLLQMH